MTGAVYTATALVHIDASISQTSDRILSHRPTPMVDGVVDSEVEILRSDAVLRRAVRQLQVRESDLSGTPNLLRQLAIRLVRAAPASADSLESETRLVRRLAEQTEVARHGATYVIGVRVANPSPVQASRLANGVAEAYVATRSAFDGATTRHIEVALAARVADLSVEVRAIEGQIDDRMLAAAAANLSQHSGVSAEQKSAVAAVLSQLADERQALFAERAEVSRALRHLEPERADARPIFSGIELSEMRDGHDERVAALQERRQQIDQRLLTLETATIDARDQLQGFFDSGRMSPAVALSLERLNDQAELTRGLYRDAVARWQDARLNADTPQAGARVLSPAMPPLSDTSLPTPLVTLLGVVAGLGFGIGIAAAREHILGGVTDAEAIELATDLQIATVLPEVSRFDAGAPQDLITNDPISDFSGAIRRLSLSLDSWRGEDGRLAVLTTSANAAEGKSTLALSLAMHSALAGKPTLLVDLDLRQSALFDRLQWQVEPDDGQLSDILSGHTPLHDVETLTFQDPLSGLHVLGNAAPPLDQPERLLTSQNLTDLMQAARQSFELIVIDCAPILSFVDARTLQAFADAVVLTMRYASTPLGDVRAALRRLEQHRGPPVLGALTFVDN